jgi:hypothetical protein
VVETRRLGRDQGNVRPHALPGAGPGTVARVAIGPMVPLTTAADPFAARVLAAHLGAEGIVWELRGNVDGPYPVGPVEVLVAEADLAVARAVVTESAVADGHSGEGTAAGGGSRSSTRQLWVLLIGVALAATLLLGRLVMLTWR